MSASLQTHSAGLDTRDMISDTSMDDHNNNSQVHSGSVANHMFPYQEAIDPRSLQSSERPNTAQNTVRLELPHLVREERKIPTYVFSNSSL